MLNVLIWIVIKEVVLYFNYVSMIHAQNDDIPGRSRHKVGLRSVWNGVMLSLDGQYGGI